MGPQDDEEPAGGGRCFCLDPYAGRAFRNPSRELVAI
jgi:hypothetical protein